MNRADTQLSEAQERKLRAVLGQIGDEAEVPRDLSDLIPRSIELTGPPTHRQWPSLVGVVTTASALVLASLAVVWSRHDFGPAATSNSPMSTSRTDPTSTDVAETAQASLPGSASTLAGVSVAGSCPRRTARQGGPAGGSEVVPAQVESTLGALQQYRAAHDQTVGMIGLIWSADRPTVVMPVSDSPQSHASIIAGLVDEPAQVLVCDAPQTEAELEQLSTDLTAELAGRYRVVARDLSRVVVVLPSTELALAEELDALYGDRLELTVGALSFPDLPPDSVCPQTSEGQPTGLTMSAEASPPQVARDGSVTLIATVSNDRSESVHAGFGRLQGLIQDGAGQVIGVLDDAPPPGSLESIDLAPGATHRFEVSLPAAPCDPSAGYTLPSGDYRLVATLQVRLADGGSTTLIASSNNVAITD